VDPDPAHHGPGVHIPALGYLLVPFQDAGVGPRSGWLPARCRCGGRPGDIRRDDYPGPVEMVGIACQRLEQQPLDLRQFCEVEA